MYHQSSKVKPYRTEVRRGGKMVSLGCFATAEEAALCVARSPEGRKAAERAASALPQLRSEEEGPGNPCPAMPSRAVSSPLAPLPQEPLPQDPSPLEHSSSQAVSLRQRGAPHAAAPQAAAPQAAAPQAAAPQAAAPRRAKGSAKRKRDRDDSGSQVIRQYLLLTTDY